MRGTVSFPGHYGARFSNFGCSLYGEPDISAYHTVRQYCVYRDCHGWSSIIAMHKDIYSFHFQFQFNLTFNGIKVENMSKSNCMQKLSHKVIFHLLLLLFLKTRISLTVPPMNLKFCM